METMEEREEPLKAPLGCGQILGIELRVSVPDRRHQLLPDGIFVSAIDVRETTVEIL
jgi:hypothetical protein